MSVSTCLYLLYAWLYLVSSSKRLIPLLVMIKFQVHARVWYTQYNEHCLTISKTKPLCNQATGCVCICVCLTISECDCYYYSYCYNHLMALCLGLPGELVPEESFTHSHILIIIQHHQLLSPTMTHSVVPVQFMCLTIFLHNVSPSPLWSTSWSVSGVLLLILHTFLYSISVFFSQHMLIPSQPIFL